MPRKHRAFEAFLRAAAPELRVGHGANPYCSFFDVTYSRLMGLGLDAHETIGLGCSRCALRFKRGRETEVPPSRDPILAPSPAGPGRPGPDVAARSPRGR